jgi:DNA gyrase subunit A
MSDETNKPGTPDDIEGFQTTGLVEPIAIQTEMEQSFLDYAMSVIVARALPDARDGLKPVHRRILWSMSETGRRPDRPHVKCATVVGDVIGKYHPHGDTAVYDAMVRMGQDFSLRHQLIDPHGNFGSPSDRAAAYRYTECRLEPLAMRLLAGLDEDTVDFEPNFDGSHDEPAVMPARFPNLLVNGSQGIAVGMATNIPPQNLGETIDAVVHLLENPEATVDDLMVHIKGPDFPTRGLILGRAGIEEAYRTGRGSIKLRARAEIIEDYKGSRIIVTEIPYQTSIEAIEVKVAELVNNKTIEGIRAIDNQSAKGATKLVFELKRDAPALVTLNNLFKHTPLQTTFAANMVALDHGIPRTMNLRDLVVAYANHQIEVITRRSQYRLDEARRREHITEGLLRALDVLDEIIALVRASENKGEARVGLMAEPFEFSEEQANHILDMTLGQLTRQNRIDLVERLEALRLTIAELEAILADDAVLRRVIIDELTEIRAEFANERRTELTIDPGEFNIEDLIDDEDLVFTMTTTGYVKTVLAEEFQAQGRGGRGIAGVKPKDGDLVSTVIHTTAHAYLLFFTSFGKVYRLKSHEIPLTSRTARGTAIVNLLMLDPEERVAAIVDTRDYETNRYLLFATRKGRVKKTKFTEYDKNRQNGLIAINLNDGDELVEVLPTNEGDDVCLITRNGRLMRFDESEARPMGRSAAGVIGMKLKGNDVIEACVPVRDDRMLLLVTDAGYGKRTDFSEFTAKHRGGQGVTAIKLTDAKGSVVGARSISPADDVLMISSGGTLIRMSGDHISEQGPYATGVNVMRVSGEERVVGVALIDEADAAVQADDEDTGTDSEA